MRGGSIIPRLNLQDEGEDCGRFRGVLGNEGAERFDQAQTDVVAEGHLGPGDCDEALRQFIEEGKIAISQVDPLRNAEQKANRLGLDGFNFARSLPKRRRRAKPSEMLRSMSAWLSFSNKSVVSGMAVRNETPS